MSELEAFADGVPFGVHARQQSARSEIEEDRRGITRAKKDIAAQARKLAGIEKDIGEVSQAREELAIQVGRKEKLVEARLYSRVW